MALQEDILAICDDQLETILWNWRDDIWAALRHTPDNGAVFQAILTPSFSR